MLVNMVDYRRLTRPVLFFTVSKTLPLSLLYGAPLHVFDYKSFITAYMVAHQIVSHYRIINKSCKIVLKPAN